MDIRSVIIQIAPISERNPTGLIEIGHYVVEDDTISMVDPEDAKRLSKPIKLNGRRAEDVARQNLRNQVLKADGDGFHRRIEYSYPGWR